MAAILKTFAGLIFYTRTCFIDYYHISFKKSHQTLRPRSCRVNQKFGPWISDYFKAILLWWFLLFGVLVLKLFVLFAPDVCFHFLIMFR